MLEKEEYEKILLERLFTPVTSGKMREYLIEGAITAVLTALFIFALGYFITGGIPCSALEHIPETHAIVLIGHTVTASCH